VKHAIRLRNAERRVIWQLKNVGNRFYQRWTVLLGLIAMLGAVVYVPLGAAYAFGTSGEQTLSMTASADDMPCHHAAKPCPHCPQKSCADMGNCLLKCFEPMPAPVSEARFGGVAVRERIAPAPSSVATSFLIPPLLRPPIV
jgi:hypothetical protein